MSFGYTQALWLKESATYGSSEDMSLGTRYVLPVKAGITLEKTIARITTEHVRGVAGPQSTEDQLGAEAVQGSFGGVVPCKGDFGVVLKHALGKIVTTGAAPPYTHTYSWTDKLFPGFSIAVNKAGATYNYHGCQIKSLKLSSKVGGPVEWTVDVTGKAEAQLAEIVAPALPALLAGTPYWLFQHGVFTIDGVIEPITEFSLDCTSELADADDSSYALGGVGRVLLPRTGYGATGTIKRRHDKDTGQISKFYAKFLSGATASLDLTFINPSDGSYIFEVQFSSIKFTGKTPNASDKGLIFEEIPFTAFNLDIGTNAITMFDAQATPGTATGSYDGTGA